MSWKNFPDADRMVLACVGRTADAASLSAYVVGGYVRDMCLGRPSKDIDIVCVGEGGGILLAERLFHHWAREATLVVFKSFGTAQVKYKDYVLEFVGARKESYEAHSRKPVVSPGTLEEDLARRDFTINAMAIALHKEACGQHIDLFGGMEDLKAQRLRTPKDPSVTFSDDPLRMLRGIRFATQLGFRLVPEVQASMRNHASRIHIVPIESITDELNKVIGAPCPSQGFKHLLHTGLLSLIFPEMTALLGVEVRGRHTHKDNFYHTLEVLDNISKHSEDLWLRWAAILHDIAKPATKRFDPKSGWTFHGHEEIGARMAPKIFRRLRLSQRRMKYVKKLIRLHLRPIALVKEEATDSAIRRLLHEAGDDIHDLMTLCRADITSKDERRVQRYMDNFRRVEAKLQALEAKDSVRNFQPPVSGEVIMEVFGLSPSPLVGEIKQAIKQAILDGHIENTYPAAYAWMLSLGHARNLQVRKPMPTP